MASPLPTYVKDKQGRAHFRGSAEYDSVLLARNEGATSRLEEILARMEELTTRTESAAEAIAEERQRLEAATAPLLERLQEPKSGEKGGEGATRS